MKCALNSKNKTNYCFWIRCKSTANVKKASSN